MGRSNEEGNIAMVLERPVAALAAFSNGQPCPRLSIWAAELGMVEVPADSTRPFWWAASRLDNLSAGVYLLSDSSSYVHLDCLIKLTAAAVPYQNGQQAWLTSVVLCNLYQPDMLDRPAKFYMKGSQSKQNVMKH